ncbi:MAG: peptidoglycan editing factor PgeF [Pseudomonadota bacterium]
MINNWIVPDWPAAAAVRAVTTTRQGGVSQGCYASMNPADHVDDNPVAVRANRETLQQALGLPGQPLWLQQVHGTAVVNAATAGMSPVADAAYTSREGVICAVLTADCLPVLLTDTAGQCVAAVHAGWRGLAAGVIEAAARAMGRPGENLQAWLGPAIGPSAYRVGDEVRDAFMAHDPAAASAFRQGHDGVWFADLYRLARQRLADCGITAVYGGGYCSFTDSERFYSYRRDGTTGRMATLIWLEE